jgi:hypothetical protein
MSDNTIRFARLFFCFACFFLIVLLAASAAAQAAQKPDIWEPLKFFLGAWEGTSKGQPGQGTCEREYQFALNGKFLQVKNKSIYSAQEKNPKGEVHEDLGFFSYDRSRKNFVLRQFHVESFVNQYLLESKSEDGKTLIFVTESIENIPAGFKAKETYRILNDNEFTETFEIAEPGKTFEVYSEAKFKRKGRP